MLQKLGTAVQLDLLRDAEQYSLSVHIFSGAGHTNENALHSEMSGHFLGSLAERSFFHTSSWISHESMRPIYSIAACDNLIAGETIVKGDILKRSY